MNKRTDSLSYRNKESSLYVEYVKRTHSFSMPNKHFHDQYEVYYLVSGERHYFIRDKTYHIQSGDLVLINKRELHKTSSTSSFPEHERILILFTESFIRSSYREQADFLLSPFEKGSPIYHFHVHKNPLVEQLFHLMLEELQGQPPGYEIRMLHTLVDILLLTARLTIKQEATPAHYLNSPIHQKITEIAGYIGDHYSEDLSLASMAQTFHISPYYLSRTFKAVTGFTLTEYVHSVRIRQAQKLLKETRLSVTEISSRIGFDNVSHFGKIFKKIAQQSPREYRA